MLSSKMIIFLLVAILAVVGQVAALGVGNVVVGPALANRDVVDGNLKLFGRALADGLGNVFRRDMVTTTVYVSDCTTPVPATTVATSAPTTVPTFIPTLVPATPIPTSDTTASFVTPMSVPQTVVTPEVPGSSVSTTAPSSGTTATSSTETSSTESSSTTTSSVVPPTSTHLTTSSSAAPSSNAARLDNFGAAIAAVLGAGLLAVV